MVTEGCSVRVIAGRHRGAVMPLVKGHFCLVGAADGNDVCLTDDNVAERHVALFHDGDALVLKPIEGGVVVGGQAVTETLRVAIADGLDVALPPSRVLLRATRSSPGGPAQPARRWSAARLPLAIASAGALALAAWVTSLDGPAVTVSTPPAERIRAVVAEQGISDRVRVSERNTVVRLNGLLEDRELTRLNAALEAIDSPVDNRVRNVKALLDDARGVFLANGYEAQLRHAGAGELIVENLDGDEPAIQRIAGFVLSDVTGLSRLTFAPAPEPGPEPREPVVYRAPNGKRLTTIVNGDTAYLVTEDGARYFVGSVLPSGHRLRRITARGVQVDHENRIAWLEF